MSEDCRKLSSLNRERNILITTLGYTKDHLNTEYYCCNSNRDEVSFCTGISSSEAGAKYILSEHLIDEIVVLGPSEAAGLHNDADRYLGDFNLNTCTDIKDSTEYDFLCYRLSQYLNKLDIEANDIIFYASKEKREMLGNMMRRELMRGRDGFFYEASTNPIAYNKFKSVAAKLSDNREVRWLKHMMYMNMDSALKMRPLKGNSDVTIRFVSIEKDAKGYFAVDDMVNIVDSLTDNGKSEVNIHIDLRGMDKADSYMMWSMLSMVNSADVRFGIKTVIHTRTVEEGFLHSIDDEIRRYDVEILLAGMQAFVNYGKVEMLDEYCRSHDIKDKSVLNLLNAMKYVDTGVSLCNTNDLTYGIQALKRIFNNFDPMKLGDNDSALFVILKKGIQKDYGALLESENMSIPELIGWALRKHFYQQALTMIESLVPADMVSRGIYYYAKDKHDIDLALENWNINYWNEIPRCRYAFNDPDHYFIKSYGRNVINNRQSKENISRDFAKARVAQLHGEYSELCNAYSSIDDTDMLYEMFFAYYEIGNLRNIVSHALTSEHALNNQEEMQENNSFDQLENAIAKFLRIYRAGCAKAEAVKSHPMIITSTILSAYTFNHRLRPLNSTPDNFLLEDSYNCQYNGQDISISIRMLKPDDSID
ncbi:MAG: hypothetical protein PHX51_04210 [Clostridia bacterium]|nr:hypothetical protein [Clostridia bacterium]